MDQRERPSPIALPTGMEMLRWLDAIVDEFNGQLDPGPKENPLYGRSARWTRSRKYESEDLNEVLFLYLQLCRGLELKEGQADAYRQKLNEGIDLALSLDQDPQAPADWAQVRVVVDQALAEDPGHPMAAVGRRFNHQLWLRAALLLDPQLPPPLPAWPMALKISLDRTIANFHGGSTWWTRSAHEDLLWACESVLAGLAQRGWFDPSEVPDPATKADLDAAETALLARTGTHKQTEQELMEWLYDPIAEKWRQHKDLQQGNMAWNRTNHVIASMGGWTGEEGRRAMEIAWSRKLSLPPKPDA